MKQIVQMGILTNLLLSTYTYALNPVQGFYGGLIGEVSHGPTDEYISFYENTGQTRFEGIVDYSPISGGAGGFLGYKFRQFRAEAEILYNWISTGPLVIGPCTLQSPNVTTPTGICPQIFQTTALGYNGSSSALYGLINAYYDFFSFEGETLFVPYVGAGIGRAQIKNQHNFVNSITLNSHGHTVSNSGNALQGIVGLSYYLDDFTWIGMDYRYLAVQLSNTRRDTFVGTSLSSFQRNNSYILNTLNFTVSFAFDKGAINC